MAMLLPRGIFHINPTRRRSRGFISCKECHRAVTGTKTKVPWAISNGYHFGGAPKVLTDLSEVELALKTPVRSFGYLVLWKGGRSHKLKGTLGYYKGNPTAITATVGLAALIADLINDQLVTTLYGPMTHEQRTRAKKYGKIRPGKLKEAILWHGKHMSLISILTFHKQSLYSNHST